LFVQRKKYVKCEDVVRGHLRRALGKVSWQKKIQEEDVRITRAENAKKTFRGGT